MKKQLVVALLSMTMSASLLFPAAVQAAEEPLNNQDNQTVEVLEELVNIDAVDKPELELIDEEPEMPADARTTDTAEKKEEDTAVEEPTDESGNMQDSETEAPTPEEEKNVIGLTGTGSNRTFTLQNPETDYPDMRVAMWSNENAQDDLVWINMKKQPDGSWSAEINLGVLKHAGLAHFHVYTGKSTNIGSMKETFSEEDVSAYSFSCTENADKRSITVKTSKTHTNMRIAVWTKTNGQDDLRWYQMKSNGNGIWTTEFSTSNLKHDGYVFIHLYTTEGGKDICLGNYNIDVEKNDAKLQEISMSSTGESRTVTVTANSTAYTNMKIAVWSKTNGQDDLKWYKMKQSSTDPRVWTTEVPLQNILHPGTVFLHVYTDSTVFLGDTTVTLDESAFPKNEVKVSGSNGIRTITVKTAKSYPDMRVAVWSAEKGQDDLRWYDMKKKSDGSWTVSVDLNKLLHAGKCNVHVYTGKSTFIGSEIFSFDSEEVAGPKLTVSGTGSTRKFSLTGAGAYTSVRAAVWSATSGQDDLIWYNMKEDSAGWSLDYSLSALKHSGKCYVHIYTGNKYVAGTSFNVSDSDYFTSLQTYGFGSDIDFVRCALNIARNDTIGYGHTWPATISCAGLVGLSLTYCGYGDFIKDDPLGWGYIDLGPEYEKELVTVVGCQVLNGPWTRNNVNELLPGDILYNYFSSTSNHIGIYLGDGMTVEARGPQGSSDIDANKREVAVYNMYEEPTSFQRVYRIPAEKIHYIR